MKIHPKAITDKAKHAYNVQLLRTIKPATSFPNLVVLELQNVVFYSNEAVRELNLGLDSKPHLRRLVLDNLDLVPETYDYEDNMRELLKTI